MLPGLFWLQSLFSRCTRGPSSFSSESPLAPRGFKKSHNKGQRSPIWLQFNILSVSSWVNIANPLDHFSLHCSMLFGHALIRLSQRSFKKWKYYGVAKMRKKDFFISQGFTLRGLSVGQKLKDSAWDCYTLTKLILVWVEGFIKASNPQRKG